MAEVAVMAIALHGIVSPTRLVTRYPPAVIRRTPPPVEQRAPIPAVLTVPFMGMLEVSTSSGPVFAYAHGTVEADGRFFIGMADRTGNPFPTNDILVFGDLGNLSKYAVVTIPIRGDVETMVYDSIHDQIYFDLSSNQGLYLYRLDPHTYRLSFIVSTSTVDAGRRPAIVTDGTYIYGITETDPSAVFKVLISDGTLTTSRIGHIPNGHSAAIGISGSTTELYFAGGMSNGFEKVRASDLTSLGTINVAPCSVSDDMPFYPEAKKVAVGTGGDVSTSTAGGASLGGLVYLGCEMVPSGIVVHTADMSRQPVPTAGLFLWSVYS